MCSASCRNLIFEFNGMLCLGEEVTDTVTLAPGLAIANQSIGVAVESEGFTGLDGIIGYAERKIVFLQS